MAKDFFSQVGNIIKRSVKLGVNKLDEFLTAEENKIKEKNSNSMELEDAFCETIMIIANHTGKFEAKTTELQFNMDYVASYLSSKGYYVSFDSDTFTVIPMNGD